MDKEQCESAGGTFVNGVCISKEEFECRAQGGRWDGTRCISLQEAQCVNNCGIWDEENKVCIALIVAFDCTDQVELSPGQFAVGWGDLPDGAKKVNVYYKPEGRPERIYKGIKADYPIPIIISGQKPGVAITWHIEAVNEWGKKVGYSNEVTTTTKS
jgi:hypothetical protein